MTETTNNILRRYFQEDGKIYFIAKDSRSKKSASYQLYILDDDGCLLGATEQIYEATNDTKIKYNSRTNRMILQGEQDAETLIRLIQGALRLDKTPAYQKVSF